MENTKKQWTASEMGKKSAEVRKTKGHDNEYYRSLANKRWNEARRERGDLPVISAPAPANDDGNEQGAQ